MNIYIGEPVEYSDMQGPCEDGFHVPTETEWTNIINAGVTLGAWTSGTPLDLSMKLKIPLAGARSTDDGSKIGQSTNGYCRACKFLMSNGYPTAYALLINSIYYEVDYTVITTGRPIRPFKNTAVQPDSSWTTIYQGTGSAGIFHNATLGLISISSDGTTWYTIADKNLGATAVWNSGDTLSESNCGYYYQRGNNYGFPRTGSVTTSTTKVSAADYGPGNYYSSNTFICVTDRPYNRDSSNNQNLRGGVTQGSGTKSVEVQNIYIGEYTGEPITTAGVYYNANLGLISVSGNGTDWITIADKNLGATTVYNYGDALTQANVGNFFQRGNNHAYPSITTPSTYTSGQVSDVSSYGPGNYYDGTPWFSNTSYNSWFAGWNANLWGDTTDTLVARRGPCDEGWHIPSQTEMSALYTAVNTTLSLSFVQIQTVLKLTPHGNIGNQGRGPVYSSEALSCFATSTPYAYSSSSPKATYGYYLGINPYASSIINAYTSISAAYAIRPFKNETVQPTSKWTKLN